MSDKKKNSDSDDDSDADYVPEEKNGNFSEEAESGDAESDIEEGTKGPTSKKRRKIGEIVENPAVEETSKIDVDALWADFKKDTDDTQKKTSTEKKAPEPAAKEQPIPPKLEPKSNMLPTTSKGGGGGGLASILSKIGKKDKLSTLEKSKLDWNNFKRAEGIEEDLQNHNRGKNGFLEKRDFLERTDMRQFEIEKQLRTLKRSTR